jgi:hypothetical protein
MGVLMVPDPGDYIHQFIVKMTHLNVFGVRFYVDPRLIKLESRITLILKIYIFYFYYELKSIIS